TLATCEAAKLAVATSIQVGEAATSVGPTERQSALRASHVSSKAVAIQRTATRTRRLNAREFSAALGGSAGAGVFGGLVRMDVVEVTECHTGSTAEHYDRTVVPQKARLLGQHGHVAGQVIALLFVGVARHHEDVAAIEVIGKARGFVNPLDWMVQVIGQRW